MDDLILSTQDELEFAECEQTIERGKRTFVEVGQALLRIRDSHLYRVKWPTFDAYCQQRWGWTKTHANRQIQAAQVLEGMTPRGVIPSTEKQMRELARVEPDRRDQVWEETLASTNGNPTAAAVRQTAETLPEKRPQPTAFLTLRTNDGQPVHYPEPKTRATFNQTEGPGISWANWSWNPVTGCLHGCVYCYAREIATSERFKASFPAGFTPLFHEQRLDAPANTVIPAAHQGDEAWRRVFVCSMADLYGRWVPDEWIAKVHESMNANLQWEYLLLTKFPARYVGLELPPTAWVGTSVDEQKRVRIAEDAFRKIDGVQVKWLSLEPLREPLEFTDLSMFDWVVIGAQTETRQPDGVVAAFQPPFDWVARLHAQAVEAGCQVHMKPNLANGKPGMSLPNNYPTTKGAR